MVRPVITPFQFLEFLISRKILSVLLSALALFKDTTAQKAAGNQPNSVTCNTRQISAANILPLNKNDNAGSKIANNNILIQVIGWFQNEYLTAVRNT